MLNFVMTAVIKFVFLMVFPTLLAPAAFAETSIIDHANLAKSRSHQQIIHTESYSNSYMITAEVELKESSETETPLSIPFIDFTEVAFATSHEKAAQNSLDDPLTPVSFLAYLSLFSISPPALS